MSRASAPNDKPDLIIYHDDLTDSDNWAAARLLLKAAEATPASTRVIWIHEPRRVSLGLSMTREQQKQCTDLLGIHFKSLGRPFKVLLGGLLKKSTLDSATGLTEEQRELLSLAIKPPYGPRDDAILHGRLMAFDLLTALRAWKSPSVNGRGSSAGSEPVEVFIDVDNIDALHQPVNLNIHHHEELVARSEDQLVHWEAIMASPSLDERVSKLRSWYWDCIDDMEDRAAAAGRGDAVHKLDLSTLCHDITAADRVMFFGGSSLNILQRLIEQGVAGKLQCYVQAGSFDLSMNLFPNQVNIALNPNAAKFVFDHFTQFGRFTTVPSSTTQIIKYSLQGLTWKDGGALERRFLGYNLGLDALQMATGRASIGDLRGKDASMPDLTAFLCAFSAGFRNSSTLSLARLDDENGVLILKRGPGAMIPVREIETPRTIDATGVRRILNEIRVEWDDTS